MSDVVGASVAVPRRVLIRDRLKAATDRVLSRAEHQGFLGLVIVAIAFRLPRLVNAADLNADYGIIALQAMHVLRGEWDWYVWGQSYQSSIESALTAPLFALFGPRPVLVLAVPFIATLGQLWIVHDILRRRLSKGMAFVISLTVAITPWAATWLSLYGGRQLAVTCSFVGLWMLDRAADKQPKRRAMYYVLGGFLPVIAVYVDVFAFQFLPAFIVFAAMCALDGHAPLPNAIGRLFLFCSGMFLGYLTFNLITSHGFPAAPSEMCFGVDKASNNLKNLTESLPATIGQKVWVPGKLPLESELWVPPKDFARVQTLGACSFLAFYFFANVLTVSSRISWQVKRLGLLAVMSGAACVASFTISCKVGDIWAMRYLAPVLWFLPFAIAPLFALVRGKLGTLILLPYLASALVTGWMAYKPAVRGARIVLTPQGRADDERWLGEALRLRGVHHAATQFFQSYRLSFLWNEDPLVVPIEPGYDRYPPHRLLFNQAHKVAYVFHPSEPRALPETWEADLRLQKIPFTREQIAGFTVIFFERPGTVAPAATQKP